MSRPKIVAGNWKMNTSFSEALALANTILDKAPESDVIKILFTPFPFLHPVHYLIQNKNHFFTGAQNCSEHSSGAYTGEVSAAMIRSVGGAYVLVGHSERRAYFNETSEQLYKKIIEALVNELNVIFCVGESLNDRKKNLHDQTVRSQLEAVLKTFNPEQLKHILIAYEPVWAIGTGETATPQQAQDMHVNIRSVLKDLFNETLAQSTPILYGGSCNAQNAKELFSCKDIDGGLIGGASLKADDFCKIASSF